MTIQELIEELEQIEDKDIVAKFWNGDTYQAVDTVGAVYSPWTGEHFVELE